jgi:hypothetical protein
MTGCLQLEEQNPAYGDEAGSSSDSSLSGGAIAGIVIGSVLGAAILAAAAVFLYKRWQQRQSEGGEDRWAPLQASLGNNGSTAPRCVVQRRVVPNAVCCGLPCSRLRCGAARCVPGWCSSFLFWG